MTRRATRGAEAGAGVAAFRSAPRELERARTRDEVRRILYPDLVDAAAIWIDAGGLSLADARHHTHLLRDVAPFRTGLAGLHGNPHTAVLDWSTVRDADVASLAALPVLLRTLASNGARVICCEPRAPRVAQLLEASGFTVLRRARWVAERPSSESLLSLQQVPHAASARADVAGAVARRRRGGAADAGRYRRIGIGAALAPVMRLVAPVMILETPTSPDQEALHDFYDQVANVVELGIVDREEARDMAALAQGALREAVANACRHAKGTCVAIAAGISRGLLPALELAVVDNGIGIARNRQQFATVLAPVPERHFIFDLFRPDASRTRRPRGSGRGFVPLAWRIAAKGGATVRVRTGGVLATLTERGLKMAVLSEASAGLGTAIHATLPLEVGSW